MKIDQFVIKVMLIVCAVGVSIVAANGQNNTANKNIKLMTSALQLQGITAGADGCEKGAGETIKLVVVSDSPVDIERYLNVRNIWRPMEFMDRKKGDEIIDRSCRAGSAVRYYSRPAGSSEPFPKP